MKAPLIVIIGETASGKSEMAMDLALKFNGEIIAADSRTIYRGLDIGSAKPTKEDQKKIRHHLIDIIEPDELFTVSDFKNAAQKAIKDITNRGKIAFLVGGSGLYVDSVLYNFEFRPPGRPEDRLWLEKLSVEDLQRRITEQGLELPNNPKNPRHLIRTLESNGAPIKKHRLVPKTLIIGTTRSNQELKARLEDRLDIMLNKGLLDEIKHLSKRYGWDLPSMQIPIYKAFKKYLADGVTLDEAIKFSVSNEMKLARKQRTWFKRNKAVHWINKQRQAVDLITTKLNK